MIWLRNSNALLRVAARGIAGTIAFTAFAVSAQTSANSAGLVNLMELHSGLQFDIHYATPDNFMNRPLYPHPVAFLKRPAANALLRVQRQLEEQGVGLVVYDAYRPWTITREMWDETTPQQHRFLADPDEGSNHNRGCAVDVGLVDLETSRQLDMGSAYDEMSPRAYFAYSGCTRSQAARREQLRDAMTDEGFRPLVHEWWHFDYRDAKSYPVLDIPFEKLETARESGEVRRNVSSTRYE